MCPNQQRMLAIVLLIIAVLLLMGTTSLIVYALVSKQPVITSKTVVELSTPVPASPSIEGGYLGISPTKVTYLQIQTATTQILGTTYNLLINEYSVEIHGTSYYPCSWVYRDTTETYGNLSNDTVNIERLLGFSGSPAKGTYNGNSITFQIQDSQGILGSVVFNRSAIGDYNTAVTNLETSCNHG